MLRVFPLRGIITKPGLVQPASTQGSVDTLVSYMTSGKRVPGSNPVADTTLTCYISGTTWTIMMKLGTHTKPTMRNVMHHTECKIYRRNNMLYNITIHRLYTTKPL